MKRFALQLLIIITVTISAIECQRWSTYNRSSNNNNSKQNGRSSAYQADNGNNKPTEANIPAKSQQSKQTVRRGIGAWGIIAITLTIILSGLGVYYFVIFYPIVCKKERMYDVMEMTTV